MLSLSSCYAREFAVRGFIKSSVGILFSCHLGPELGALNRLTTRKNLNLSTLLRVLPNAWNINGSEVAFDCAAEISRTILHSTSSIRWQKQTTLVITDDYTWHGPIDLTGRFESMLPDIFSSAQLCPQLRLLCRVILLAGHLVGTSCLRQEVRL